MSSRPSASRRVAVMGLGLMGSAIAANLVKGGMRVRGFDPSSMAQQKAAAAGIEVQPSVAQAIEGASIVLASLPSAEALGDLTTSLVASPSPASQESVLVELSTLPIAVKEAARDRLSKRGWAMLDAPISGTGAQAVTKDLVVYASGQSADFDVCAPIFDAFARKTFFLGAFGNGMKMKCVANLLVAIHNVATAEAIHLGVQSGLDAQKIYDVISSGAGTSKIFELRGPMMVKGLYEPPTMKLGVWQKDMDLIAEFATELGASTPAFDATFDVYKRATALAGADKDTAAVFEAIKSLNPNA